MGKFLSIQGEPKACGQNRFMYQLCYFNCVHYNYVATMLSVSYYYKFITTINFNLILYLNKIEENPVILDNIKCSDEASF